MDNEQIYAIGRAAHNSTAIIASTSYAGPRLPMQLPKHFPQYLPIYLSIVSAWGDEAATM